MTEFEYISVAVALIFALVIGRLLAALPDALEPEKRYWPHVIWIVASLLVCSVVWWGAWGLREVDWNPPRFLALLLFPSLLYVRAVYLCGNASEIVSYEDHFYAVRARFFGVGAAESLFGVTMVWIMGMLEVGQFQESQAVSLILIFTMLSGVVIANKRFHEVWAVFHLAFSFIAILFVR